MHDCIKYVLKKGKNRKRKEKPREKRKNTEKAKKKKHKNVQYIGNHPSLLLWAVSSHI